MRDCARSFVAMVVSLLPGCAFGPLEELPPSEELRDDLPGSITIADIQVSPAVIHPGDTVTLRDPVAPEDAPPHSLYYWAACDGAIAQKNLLAREATWIAPRDPGIYAVTVNITNKQRDSPSRVLPLCVVPQGAKSCSTPMPATHTVVSLTATPDHFIDCPGGCETTLRAEIDTHGAASTAYRWETRSGQIVGAQAVTPWRLPRVSCCPETFTAVLTACSPDGVAATGFATVTVEPE